jgi:hypothetical protein
MAFDYERDDERRRIVIRFTDALTVEGICRVADRHETEHVWGYAMLYDLTNVTVMPTRDDVQRIADYVQRHAGQRPRGPIAVVAADAALLAVARLYATLASPRLSLNVFDSVVNAEQWFEMVATGFGV